MIVLVCGGRRYSNRDYVFDTLDEIAADITLLIHGGAPGADTLANEWAKSRNVQCECYPAVWDMHGKAAGPLRNQRMLDEGKPDLVIAFPGGVGTADMVQRAERAGVEVLKF